MKILCLSWHSRLDFLTTIKSVVVPKYDESLKFAEDALKRAQSKQTLELFKDEEEKNIVFVWRTPPSTGTGVSNSKNQVAEVAKVSTQNMFAEQEEEVEEEMEDKGRKAEEEEEEDEKEDDWVPRKRQLLPQHLVPNGDIPRRNLLLRNHLARNNPNHINAPRLFANR